MTVEVFVRIATPASTNPSIMTAYEPHIQGRFGRRFSSRAGKYTSTPQLKKVVNTRALSTPCNVSPW